jgi:hypothetical protein
MKTALTAFIINRWRPYILGKCRCGTSRNTAQEERNCISSILNRERRRRRKERERERTIRSFEILVKCK